MGMKPLTPWMDALSTLVKPESLIDLQCNTQNIVSHLKLPPTLGSSRMENGRVLTNLQNRSADFSGVGNAVTYTVTARFLTKSSKWEKSFRQFTNKHKGNGSVNNGCQNYDGEFVILKEIVNDIRVVPTTATPISEYERNFQCYHNMKLYNHFINRINNWINWGKELQLCSQVCDSLDDEVPPVDLLENEQTIGTDEIGHNYTRIYNSRRQQSRWYQVQLGIYKSSLLLGKNAKRSLISVKTPLRGYRVSYIPPSTKVKHDPGKTTFQSAKLNIPLEVSMENMGLPSKPIAPCEIKHVGAELEIVTITSTDKTPIPMEFESAFWGNNNGISSDNFSIDDFQNAVVNPMKQYYRTLNQMKNQLGSNVFTIDNQLMANIKILSNLTVNTTCLKFNDLIVNGKMYCSKDKPPVLSYTKPSKFNLLLDLRKLTKRGEINRFQSDWFTLLPSFQSCYIARMYHVKVSLLIDDKAILIRVPVVIEKREGFNPLPYYVTLSTC